jgi:AcrR family transcriptional regulator
MKCMSRKYELKKRAESMEDTRQRITEAAMDLHGSLGPARTTVTAVAERAGVQRHTVYRHFPTDDDLFVACSGHFAELHPWPDQSVWQAIEDPRERLATGLDQLYRYYEETGFMWSRILRDRELNQTVERHLSPFNDYVASAARVLSTGWGARGNRKRVLGTAVRHAVDFATWQSLVDDGDINRGEAVRLMTALVEGATVQ